MTKQNRSSEARERLIETANRLFYENGIQGTGIDRVIAEASVAKATLYSNFSSKDELVLATLQKRDQENKDALEAAFRENDFSPREKILFIFRFLQNRLTSSEFRGCHLLNAATEYCDCDHPVRQYVRNSRLEWKQLFTDLAAQAGVENAPLIGERLSVIMYGAVAFSLMTGSAGPANDLPAFAELVLNGAPYPASCN